MVETRKSKSPEKGRDLLMALVRLTDTVVRSARPSKTRYELTDRKSQGLVLRVTPRGEKIWAARYYYRGKQCRATLGNYPDVSLAAARERAAQIRSIVQQGEDPIAAKKKAAEALKYGETVADLVRAWRERHALLKNRSRTIEAYDSIARRVILPAIG